jgi:hypothetical protein
MTIAPEFETGLEFDLAPHPRILPMLGEITLHQWQCCAELVDNSIDGFLRALREGQPVDQPSVSVILPTSEAASARVMIRDNGPGMTADVLQSAVKAGWTSNDPINNMGLFGMGFNIATAKLGRVTRVWTTRAGDAEEVGLEIDFDRMTANGHFRTRQLRRPKADPAIHGTEITVERLKPEQRQWLKSTGNRNQIVRKLSESYAAMLRAGGKPLQFELTVNNQRVRGHEHCVWGLATDGSPAREVEVPNGAPVNAVQQFDFNLPGRPFCQACWQWLQPNDTECPSCTTRGKVVLRERRVHGWLGVQRYLSESDFGVDFLRNGRKVEIGSKDLFDWRDLHSDAVTKEYPIDDQRHRGRLVGEVHIDHCRVNYTKSLFDRDDPAWNEMTRLVRGEAPLRPNVASANGFAPNSTPLSVLYQVFRRSSPQRKIAGCYRRLLLVPPEINNLATEYAKKYRDGQAQYRSDEEWWNLVEQADDQLLVQPASGADGTGSASVGGGILPGFGAAAGVAPGSSIRGGAGTGAAPLPAPAPVRNRVHALSREYRDPASAQRWTVEAFEVADNDPDLAMPSRPWALKADPNGVHRFLFNPRHPVFRSVTMTPSDGLLAELAWSVMDFQRGRTTTLTFADVLASLRDEYGEATRLDTAALASSAEIALSAIARTVAASVGLGNGSALYEELTSAERENLYEAMAAQGVANHQQLVADGGFITFLGRRSLLRIFDRHPELFFDGRCWDDAYDSLIYPTATATEEARQQVVRRYAGLLNDVLWLAQSEPTALADASRPRLLRAAMAVEQVAIDE